MKFNKNIQDLIPTMKKWRQTIHSFPEIAYEEFKTSEFIEEKLKSFGIKVYKNFGTTGLVGVLEGNKSSSKSKVKKNTTKEIKFRPSTDVGDFNIKLKKIKSFILDGDKTKISVRFRGREILNSEMGLSLLNKIKDELSDIAQVDQDPSLEGRQLLMMLSPLKKKN